MKKGLLLTSVLIAGLTSCSSGPGYYLYEYWHLRAQRQKHEELTLTVGRLKSEQANARRDLAQLQSKLRELQRRVDDARAAGDASSLRDAEAEFDRLRREEENEKKRIGALEKQIKEREEVIENML